MMFLTVDAAAKKLGIHANQLAPMRKIPRSKANQDKFMLYTGLIMWYT